MASQTTVAANSAMLAVFKYQHLFLVGVLLLSLSNNVQVCTNKHMFLPVFCPLLKCVDLVFSRPYYKYANCSLQMKDFMSFIYLLGQSMVGLNELLYKAIRFKEFEY